MFRRVNLLILSLALLCAAPAAYAGDVSEVAEEVKAIVREKAPCWKLFRQQERKIPEFWEIDLDFVCGKASVIAYLYQTPSVEAAAKLLYEIVTSPVQSSATIPGHPVVTDKFGDESYVGAYFLYTRSSYVYFRKGHIVVRIDSSSSGKASSKKTLKNAVIFAQFLAQHMPPTNSSSERGMKRLDTRFDHLCTTTSTVLIQTPSALPLSVRQNHKGLKFPFKTATAYFDYNTDIVIERLM
jgi:hypothetical protein